MNKEVLELRDKRGVLLDEAEALQDKVAVEKRGFTPEERTEVEAKLAEIEALAGQIKDAELRGKVAEVKLDDEIRSQNPGPRALPVESRKNYNQWPVDEAWQWLHAVRSFHAGGSVPSDIHEDYQESFRAVASGETRAITGHGTLVEQDGGFSVPETINAQILQKVNTEGQLISRCQAVPVTVGNTAKWNAVTENSRASGSRYGGITVARVGEGGSITASKAATEQVKLELKKQAAAVYVTDEQLEDGPQLMTLITSLVPKAIVFDTEDEIYNGPGTMGCQGVLNAPALVSVAKETGQAAATILFENIIKMYARMYGPSRSSAAWLINQDIEPQLFSMSLAIGTGGVPVYMPANGVSGSPFATLMGRPVIPIEHAATLGTKGDILFVDMSQYLYATKGSIKSASSMHVRFLNDEQVFKFTQRNDGKSWWPAALTPAKGSNTLSPFVALDTRS